MSVRGQVTHNGRPIESLQLRYAGRTNVFETRFQLPEVKEDYEVLAITVTAMQAQTTNFGVHQRTFKLLP